MTELEIQRCQACGTGLFPERLRCPRCGQAVTQRQPAGPGRVEEETHVRRPPAPSEEPVRLGSVRLDAGPVVVARLGEEARKGEVVRLEVMPGGAIWARSAERQSERGEG